jgi:hypothetical protein
MTTLKQTFTIAGLKIEVFSDPAAVSPSVPVVAFFLLHGRLSSSRHVEHIAESLIQFTREVPKSIELQREQRDLIVITFVGDFNQLLCPELQYVSYRITETMGRGW